MSRTACKQSLLRGAILLAWMGVIFYFSNQPNSNEVTESIFGGFNYFVRKGAHMTEYAILNVLTLWFQASIVGNPHVDRFLETKASRQLVFPFLLTVLYAMSDEWHQSFVPGRSALFSDVLIDSSGSAIASFFSYLWLKKSVKNTSS